MLLNFVPMATIVSESDYDSSCSSITVPDSTRSWISNLSFGSNRLSSVSVQSTPADLVPSSLYASQKPHKANQAAWEAMRQLRAVKDGRVGLEHFRLLRRLGSGDIGNVYLCQIRNIPVPAKGGLARPPPPECMYAMKVVDREALAVRNKLGRAEMEKEILGMLDHPFLPTLYAEFEASHYSCLVMEFCPGGDLYAARQRLPGKRFSVSAAKFYAAETILAIEYLHMMGIVYRDLKPENVLVREDGHIMLSDFDLCLKCEVVPKLLRSQTTKYHKRHAITKVSSSSSSPSSPTPSCYSISSSPMQPVLSCFSKSSRKKKSPKTITTITEQAHSNDHHHDHHDHDSDQEYYDPELVAEPIEARSKSFVGTHEYLAPEVISGQGHGSAVDWWTLGVFLYELLYGKTPFKGENNEQTLINILKQPLSFPRSYSNVRSCSEEEEEMWRVEDLIRKLLVKNPKKRMGGLKGSVEIKRHDFFKGVNWALIRSVKPPQNPNCNTNDSDNRIKSKIRANYLPKLLSKKEREEPYQIPQHHQHQYPHHSHHHHHHVEYF